MGAIGVFGGSFDPIHIGHLRTACELWQKLSLDEVRFLPCRIPPHRDRPVAPAELRLQMVRAATEGQSGFVVDDRELKREGPSYSIDTLASLRADYPARPLALLVGMDALLSFPDWHRWREIFDFAHVIVAHRPGWKPPTAGRIGQLLSRLMVTTADELFAHPAGRIYVQPVTQLEISSSAIRVLVASGADPAYLVTDTVREIIAASGCYVSPVAARLQREETETGA
jgi:nicotinate-nucleotide adenylyltransferase